MIHDEFPGVALHNVAETSDSDWTDGGHHLRRVPASVADRLNVSARERMRLPTGCELRFVPEQAGSAVEVTLSAAERTRFRVFWGAFQEQVVHEIGPTPRTIEFRVPDRTRQLADDSATGAFEPHVCRLRFEYDAPVAVHAVSGRSRPPACDETPDLRYLAHGTSITEGFSASACHLSYVTWVARRLGLDPVNLGAAGSAFCEPAMAEYLANRDDWDVATLALSVNMANRGFTREQFRERVRDLVRSVAEANPDRPVGCITLFPYHEDVVRDGDRERAAAFRAALRNAVDACETDNVHLIEGPEVMGPTGLTTDLLHPGDAGMAAIGEGVARAMSPLVE